ncbi:guanine nucleotide exchange factor in mesoderm isoform X2 [Anticarsia gemmatalis]
MITGGVKLPIATFNKSSLYAIRTKCEKEGVSDDVDKCNFSDNPINKLQRTFKEAKQVSETTFDNLSPNVKRMISSATETTTLKFQKKTLNIGRTSMRRSNIPLVGATSKISQSGVEILPSVEIYDQPCAIKNFNKSKSEDHESPKPLPLKPEFKIDDAQTYDVPTNNRPAIYDVPVNNKTAFESLSLPYIDQSIELSITSNDREFDIKLSSKDNSPMKPVPKSPSESPAKIAKLSEGTNSLHRKDFVNKNESPSKLLSKAVPYPEAVGSTGNLKCEKEVIRLNPPVVEVSRPLSMSSIASSSSTSSSGVQNKGGVNSAYLASIESLDDHSDADMVSANGSNNFVNNAGIMTASVSEERTSEDTPRGQIMDEMSGLSQLERVCAEIVQTENVYVEDLRQVVEGYLHVWRREMMFSDEQLSELFNNIEDIYAFNRSLCAELNTCRLDATSIARCFVTNTTGFSVYTSYCTGYPRTMERLAALASEPRSAREFRERQIELGHLLPLASYLLKPVQRILKYHLLLQNVVKQCASRETEYALLKMTGIAQHIDDMKRRHEHAVRVQEIQSLLYGWNGPDLTTYGELCAEGTFRVFGAKAMRHAFLFDKMLLVTKNREDGILAYKSHIMCNNMMLVESIAGAPLSFHVIPWDAPRHQLTLQARSPRHKREWTLLLKRVILENYNAVIPSHARQLVMELGQNKTDDDMLAEKSHNLITQASMRKQLSAPEYLEKRKLERDRRKSFESGIRGRLKKGTRKYTVPSSRAESQECDCPQVSAEKGTDYTCDNCYVDLCSDCETELGKVKREEKCSCRHEDNGEEKCPECDRSLHYIDSGSAEHLERKPSGCKCSDFKSSQESFGKEFGCSLNKTRGYHSSDNIIGYTETSKSKEDLSDNNSLSNVRHIPKTCLKCAKIKENIVVTDSTSTLHTRRSRCNESEKHRTDTLRSKSKDDPQRSKLSKIGTWRRKSEPGLQQNMIGIINKKSQDSDNEKPETRGNEKIEFECKNCGSNKITRKNKTNDGTIISDTELDGRKRVGPKPTVEIRMYNTKNIPKKISKIKKNRAKGLRLGSDTTAKFYADFSTDVSTENILHISESTDSLNVDKQKDTPTPVPETISKDESIDEETYKKLIEKTDSFKKNELEKVKYLNQQKVINEGSEAEERTNEAETKQDEVVESCEETEQPLEQIISQLLMQNREFQKLIKKQQLRNSAQRRHQRLMKSHSSPEQTVLAKNLESTKLKPKYGRQTSENLESDKTVEDDNTTTSSKTDLTEELDEDHIYETLRVERVDGSLHSLNAKSKAIQHVTRPKRLPSPPSIDGVTELPKHHGPESDYVYLSFDKLNQLQNPEGIYDVPVRSPEKVPKRVSAEYYVTMEHKGPAINEIITENVYDTLVEVCRRKKEVPSDLPSDYLPMSPDQQSPNTPEIWLSRQKEHFNVSRDRKSGSLPRSFQVITSSPDENLSTFKCKPNSNSKTYLNRDGKVMSTDRPFTIASDQSEISYDDMSEGDILKFNKSKTSETDYVQNISQSTLELEEEIDRCYKTNFEELNLDKNKNENLLTVSQPNLNVSTTSSCEVLPLERNDDTKSNDIEVIHPEHKIYKPTSNMLSLKNVLSRFKNRTPNKNTEEGEINANDQSSPDSAKSDLKSPTNEKRSALNPRSYSKNLLQRFRSIIGDEHTDDNQNKSETTNKIQINEDLQNNLIKSDIKVVITSTDASPTTSTIVYALNNELLSKSVCEHTTMTDSQNEKNNLETLSMSCDNLNKKPEIHRPTYEKSVSMVASMTTSIGSPSKSTNNSYHSLNKLPIYMQGSKHLGARIAQSDYVDPTTLVSDKTTTLKKVNVLINKNAVRPDSLFSNSSFVTSSSEGAYQEPKVNTAQEKSVDSPQQTNSDESYYEKSFEKIEQVTDEDVFRDSAVYSDQEDSDTKEISTKEIINKNITRVESIKSKTTFKTQQTINEKTTHTRVVVTSKTANVERVNSTKRTEVTRPKVAPPVPVKPKITQIPSTSNFQSRTASRTPSKSSEQSSSSESVNMKTIKRNVNYKQSIVRSESTPINEKTKNDDKMIKSDITKPSEAKTSDDNSDDKLKPQGNIHMKRLSFERASLDSATRKLKPAADGKKSLLEQPKSSKSVLERRMEIEQLSKTQVKVNPNGKKPIQAAKPKPITTKVANFERSVSDISVKEKPVSTPSTDKNIPNRNSVEKPEIEGEKGSWVKQVVNKFQ